jgi:hypothetical protein
VWLPLSRCVGQLAVNRWTSRDEINERKWSEDDGEQYQKRHFLGIVTVTALAARPEGDQTGGMTPPPDPHYRHRFPAEIISYAVWLYHVFSLSLRDVELILAERGVVVSLRDGATLVQEIRRKWMRCSSGSRACSTIFGAH